MSHHHTSPATLSFIIFYNTQPAVHDTEAAATIVACCYSLCSHNHIPFQKLLISLLLAVSTIVSNIFVVNRRLT